MLVYLYNEVAEIDQSEAEETAKIYAKISVLGVGECAPSCPRRRRIHQFDPGSEKGISVKRGR